MKKYIIGILVFCIAVGCEAKKEIGGRRLGDDSGTIDNSMFIERIDFLYLKDRDGFMLSNISDIGRFNGNWYVLDNDRRQAVAVFDSAGEPLGLYDRKGRGPGEYDAIADFDVCPQSGMVGILSRSAKLIILNEKLDFIREIEMDKPYCRLMWYGDNGLLLFSGADAAVDYLSLNDGSVKRLFETSNDLTYVDSRIPHFIRNADRIYFQTESDDVLYRIDNFEFIPILTPDYKNRDNIQKFMKQRSPAELDPDKVFEYVRPGILCVIGNGVNLSLIYKNIMYRMNMTYGNDIRDRSLKGFFLNPTLIGNNHLVSWTYSYNYNPARFNESGIYDGITVNHIPWDDRSREGGNPVLIIYTLKPEFAE